MDLQPVERQYVSKSVLTPDSEIYQEIKKSCLRGDFCSHFLERDFSNFDKSNKIILYEYHSFDFDNVKQVYEFINKDKADLEYKEVIVLYDIAKAEQLPIDILNNVWGFFDKLDLSAKWGMRRTIKMFFMCC